jgi:hypothetical protein
VITPGLTICYRCRTRDAELVLEPGERWAEALCFACIADLIERENAVAVNRDAAALIAVAGGELELRESGAGDLAETISTPALEQARRRCWAFLPAGTRCKRKATCGPPGQPFLCDTHRHGCKVPGLGWTLEGRPATDRILEAAA